MITARINHGKDTLLFEMPHHGEPIDDLLEGIGIQIPAAQIPMSGIEEAAVTLTYSDQMGKALLDKLDRTESIGELNSLCDRIVQTCGFEDHLFAVMVSSSEARTIADVEYLRKCEDTAKFHPEQAGENIKIMDCPFLYGGPPDYDSERIENSPEAIVDFICREGQKYDLEITDPAGYWIMDTFGPYINRCIDQQYLQNELLPVLIPKQHDMEVENQGFSVLDM